VIRTPGVFAPFVSSSRVAQLVIATTTAAVEALFVWRFGWSIALVPYGYFGVVAVLLAAHDLATRTLPNAIVLPSYPIALALFALASAVGHDWSSFVRAVVAMVVVGFAWLALAVGTAGQAGLGDVKLGALVGLYAGWLSWSAVFLAVLAGFLLAACWGLPISVRRRKLRYRFALGPFLLGGAVVAILIL
jgi:leader peptidase (prepilin peptidase)/N-methyltransferase